MPIVRILQLIDSKYKSSEALNEKLRNRIKEKTRRNNPIVNNFEIIRINEKSTLRRQYNFLCQWIINLL